VTPERTPLSDEVLLSLAREHGTPLFVYSASTIRARIAELRARFDVVRYAQKANSNLALLALVREAGCASMRSAGEVERARAEAEEIAFTADLSSMRRSSRHEHALREPRLDRHDRRCTRFARPRDHLRVNPASPRPRSDGRDWRRGLKHGIGTRTSRSRRDRARHGLSCAACTSTSAGLRPASLLSVREALARFVEARTVTSISPAALAHRYREEDTELDVEAYVEAGALRARRWNAVSAASRPETEPGRYLVAEAGVLVCEVRTKRVGRLTSPWSTRA
jgi:diaminopimelate decarboxylase